jgi:hypothetical protein
MEKRPRVSVVDISTEDTEDGAMTDEAWREGFDHLHEGFTRLHQCMDRLETKLDAVETELDSLMACMRDGFARIDTRLDCLESRLGQKASR